MKIGMLIAVEIKAFVREYNEKYTKETLYGFDVYKVQEDNIEIIAIHSEAGQTYAAAATMLLINKFNVEVIINYGVVGALKDNIKTMHTAIVEKIVHYDFDTSELDDCEVGYHVGYEDVYLKNDKELIDLALNVKPDLPLLTLASGDKFIGNPDKKRKLGEDFKADICDMEGAGIALIADRAKIPYLMIKTISDSLEGEGAEFFNTFKESSHLCMKITKEIVAHLGKHI